MTDFTTQQVTTSLIHSFQKMIIVVLGHKGGIGKTTTSVSLATWFANKGLRVALVDLDAQSHVVKFFGLPRAPGLANVLIKDMSMASQLVEAPSRAWRDKPGDGALYILPADRSNESVWTMANDAHILRDKTLALLDTTDVDLVLYDTPPAVGDFATSVMLAARWLIIPAPPSPLAIEGVLETLATMRSVYDATQDWADDERPTIELLGVIPNRHKGTVLHQIKTEEMQNRWPVFPVVPERTAFEECTEFGQTIWKYTLNKGDKSSNSARASMDRS